MSDDLDTTGWNWAPNLRVVENEPPVDGAALLDEIRAAYTSYVIFPSPEAADAVTLYTAATHAQAAWEHATRLVIKSPLKRCGKTRLQEVARELVHQALPTTNISPAALARSITEDDPPTLILDEADSVWGKKEQRSEGAEDLRGILNSGHSRGWPYVRWDPAARKRELCPTFAMAIIGGIGDMPDTIEDRAVVIAMRRRALGEYVTPWRTRRAVPALRALRDRVHEWVKGQLDDLSDAEPDLPVEDRAADCWEPLAAVADFAGGDWPARARKACHALSDPASRPDDATAGERLLADLYELWGDAPYLFTSTLLDQLHALDEAPWGDWYGRKLNPRDMARLLKPYGIQPRTVRESATSGTSRGYARADLADAWTRYTRPADTSDTAQQAPETLGLTSQNGCVTSVSDSDFRSDTTADQHRLGDRVAVSLVSGDRLDCAICRVCGDRLDPVLAAAGDDTHPGCAR